MLLPFLIFSRHYCCAIDDAIAADAIAVDFAAARCLRLPIFAAGWLALLTPLIAAILLPLAMRCRWLRCRHAS
jgi:hypothetical protein